jgi:hypothetical protein
MWTIGRRKAERGGVGHWAWLGGLFLALWVAGCATPGGGLGGAGRSFVFEEDTFSYANELVWEYGYDEQGRWRGRAREPKPAYTHHCFVVARSAKQFFCTHDLMRRGRWWTT